EGGGKGCGCGGGAVGRACVGGGRVSGKGSRPRWQLPSGLWVRFGRPSHRPIRPTICYVQKALRWDQIRRSGGVWRPPPHLTKVAVTFPALARPLNIEGRGSWKRSRHRLAVALRVACSLRSPFVPSK